jgi:hypothetical protein
MRSLQTGNPRSIHLIATTVYQDYLDVNSEKEIHLALKDYRLRGEWFDKRPVYDWLCKNRTAVRWAVYAGHEFKSETDWRRPDTLGCLDAAPGYRVVRFMRELVENPWSRKGFDIAIPCHMPVDQAQEELNSSVRRDPRYMTPQYYRKYEPHEHTCN